MNRIFKDPDFYKLSNKILSKSELNELSEFILRLKKSSYLGKPLGYKFFREHKIGGKRVYYLIYEDLKIVLFVGVSKKKIQQDTIDEVKNLFKEYRKLALLLSKED